MAKPVVLIVEDERPIATLLAKLVEGCGADTAVAYNGSEALRWMMDRRPDLVLLDLIMPLVSGEEVLEQMASDPQLATVPVIVITTRDMMPETPHREHLFIQKPFAPAEVRQHVCKALKLTPPAS